MILAQYLEATPERLRFQYTDFGKPFLIPEQNGPHLRFNVSHSNGLALYAVTFNREVGVDLEYMRPDLATMQLAAEFFSAHEFAALQRLPSRERIEGFFNCWTRKEAYVKARGEGLSLPLDQFDVSLVPGEQARLLDTPGDPKEAKRWSLRALSPGKGYAAALAVKGHSWRSRCWQGTALL
jgi:4'-phosphopantetheinyl transferase